MYRITHIAETKLDSKVMSELEAVKFFNNMGVDFWEAKRGLIPAFVVKEIKTDSKETVSV